MKRICIEDDCLVDISDRRRNSVRCVECQAERERERKRKTAWESRRDKIKLINESANEETN